MLKIKIPGFTEIDRKLKGINTAVEVAAARSVGKVSVTARAEWARLIHAEINLPVGVIKSAIRIGGRNTHGAAGRARMAEVVVDSANAVTLGVGRRVRAIPVIKFKPRQTKRGISVAIKRSKGRSFIKSGFLATMKTGHTGAFVRKGKARLPIKELHTTAVEDVALDKLPDVQRVADEELKRVFGGQLRYELNRRGMRIIA